ncbi:SIS domain-containing protein [Enterococcus gallinarum]|uniref:SIS domain-containing protein n=1 Tax=Enterococcus gallinarum TaxID=1353 RepID=UPI00288FD693|nr:SIS domain-containing protein [Enterococcus gallinarum]MDT2730402.1 SIS domain-containing protein [Enterococcus gallinarum]
MSEENWDMYDYILESKDAVRSIVKHKDQILEKAVEYFFSKKINRMYIVGSGTSYHAGLAAQSVIEKILDIPIVVQYPMEFKDQEFLPDSDTLVVGISHAGRSTSTISALDKAREKGYATIAATAEKNKPILEHADCSVEIAIGPEYAGPKTKGYIGTVATLVLFALEIALKMNKITDADYEKYVDEMLETTDQIPAIAEASVKWYEDNKQELIKSRRIIIVGYEQCKSALLEGTLKVLEAVRYSVTGYEMEEFMHGVYHSIDEDTYMLYIGCEGQYYDRMINMKNYFEKERGNKNFVITSDEGQVTNKNNLVYDFKNNHYFASLEYVVPFQVLARKLSLDLGIDCNVSSDPHFHKKMGSYTY